jgi:hypothetical protein
MENHVFIYLKSTYGTGDGEKMILSYFLNIELQNKRAAQQHTSLIHIPTRKKKQVK